MVRAVRNFRKGNQLVAFFSEVGSVEKGLGESAGANQLAGLKDGCRLSRGSHNRAGRTTPWRALFCHSLPVRSTGYQIRGLLSTARHSGLVE